MTGFLDRLKGAIKGSLPVSVDPVSKQLLEALLDEVVAGIDNPIYRIRLSECPSWKPVKTADGQQQINLAIAAIARISFSGGGGASGYWARREALPLIAGQLLRRRLQFTAADLAPMLFKVAKSNHPDHGFPTLPLLTACERLCDGKPAQGELRSGLMALKARLNFQGQQ